MTVVTPNSPVSQQQQLNVDQSQIASATGTATFIFPNVPVGQTWTGTLLCSGAPVSAEFTAIVGSGVTAQLGAGTNWGAWAGTSVAGPVQAQEGQVLVVNATGLTPGSTYLLSWRGWAEPTATADLTYPLANASSILSAISQGSVDLLGQALGVTPGAGLTFLGDFIAQHSYNALVLEFSEANAVAVSAFAEREVGHVSLFPAQTQTPSPVFDNSMTFVLPIVAAPGDPVGVWINPAFNPGVCSWAIYGVTATPIVEVIAPVGNPLSTTPRGGLLSVNGSIGVGGPTTLLAAPTYPNVYRLHRFSCFEIGADATQQPVTLYDGTSTFLSVLTPQTASQNLDGQEWSNVLSVFNDLSGTVRVTLTYDVLPIASNPS